MTRQEMIDKLYGWYVEWLDKDGFAEFNPTGASEMKDSKWKSLNSMTDEALKELYVMELIRRESHAKEQS
jgi:hypothetical protein